MLVGSSNGVHAPLSVPHDGVPDPYSRPVGTSWTASSRLGRRKVRRGRRFLRLRERNEVEAASAAAPNTVQVVTREKIRKAILTHFTNSMHIFLFIESGYYQSFGNNRL